MTPDEKLIWAAVFASEQMRIQSYEEWMTRGDLLRFAATEADNTIAAIRRDNDTGNFVSWTKRGLRISPVEES